MQILSPRRDGGAGTQTLNALTRKGLGKVNVAAHMPFAVGDRVIQTVTNYDLGESGIMNCTVGTVVEAGSDGVTVDFDGELVDVASGSLGDMEHAYAVTVHKSQGSQYRAVVIPLYASAGRLLNRQMVYTALTRAEELVVLVGTPESFAKAVSNHAASGRATLFSHHLGEALNEVAFRNLTEPQQVQQRLLL